MYQFVQSFSHKCCYLDSLINESVIPKIKNLIKQGKGKSIMKFDFFTLNSMIVQRKLLKISYELTDFCFHGGSYNINENKFGK